MEETIRALQASDPRHSTSYLDSTLFPGMQIPAKVKVDLGIKLGRLEGPTKKREGESSRRTASATTPTGGRRSKEASVNAVNAGHNAPQQYSTPQYRPPASRTPRPTQRAPAPQGQQGGAMQARPLSHIYRQLLAGDMIRPTILGPSFVLANQDQSLHCEYHSSAPGHTTDNCWKLREEVQKLIDAKKISFNAIRPPNVQANPLPDHGSSSGPTINMISICTKKVTKEEAEAFMKVIKASEYKCNNFIIGRVMIDNGSALNVCPLSTLKQMNVDLNCVRPSKTAV
ncbi:hypothetical protein CRG98_023095 [Punica granatum]|uniref:Uncharacterized protein n=1 Tax=Punica granatum TaxID=22663 RepID=A0A2I0JJM6_PUNGR|nr:hypothetical protein CRG98_023095 [Punica granatum]